MCREEERIKLGKEIWQIAVEERGLIGVVGLRPASQGVRVVKNNMGNIPRGSTTVRTA